MNISNLYPYQVKAVDHILTRNGSMLWLDIGLGKTITTLTAISTLIDRFQIKAVLVVAPVAVCETVWRQEAKRWSHTKWLKFSTVRGDANQRKRALLTPAHVYLTNYELIERVVGALDEMYLSRGSKIPFDMVVFDEISKMKMATTKRVKAFSKILPHFRWRVGLTGTPATNGLLDLHGQFLMIDGGKRLGPNITSYRDRWFINDAYAKKWNPRRGAGDEIRDRISDITITMKAEDYISLPDRIDQTIEIEFPKTLADKYREFEREFFIELEGGGEVEAFNSGALSMKCRQMANGACYLDDTRTAWSEFHSLKLDAVQEIVDALGDSSTLVCYQFRHDLERLLKRFPKAVAINSKTAGASIEAWNSGEIKMMIGHPASMGHGLNLQYGGCHVVWFGLPWSLELYDQAIGRLHRNGQKSTVINHRIIVKDTIEEAIKSALVGKSRTQSELRGAVERYGRLKEAGRRI